MTSPLKDTGARFEMVEQGLTFSEVAKDLGISDSAVRAWKREFHYDGTLVNNLNQGTSIEAELKRLREENRQLRMEREILPLNSSIRV